MKVLYTTRATATGGRNGEAATEDGKVAVRLSVPKEMGGDGGPGTNPEQLFATGYSACFLGALRNVAGKAKVTIPPEATVTAEVSFADRQDNVGFTIKAALTIAVPGADRAVIEDLVQKAHLVCPYSHALTHAGDVALTVA